MPTIQLHDKTFDTYISEQEIQEKIKGIADQINKDYKDKRPLFIAILNGSFMFAADLFKYLTIDAEISFIKLVSYKGMKSSGNVITSIGLEAELFGREVIIVEDIVDTGFTLLKIAEELKGLGAKSVEVVTLLRKKPARDKNIKAKYTGFEIENEFVLGYGLDYDGLGRNFKEIYKAEA